MTRYEDIRKFMGPPRGDHSSKTTSPARSHDLHSTSCSSKIRNHRSKYDPLIHDKHRKGVKRGLLLKLIVVAIIYFAYGCIQREHFTRCRSTFVQVYLFRTSKMCAWMEQCINAIEVMLGLCITAAGNSLFRALRGNVS